MDDLYTFMLAVVWPVVAVATGIGITAITVIILLVTFIQMLSGGTTKSS